MNSNQETKNKNWKWRLAQRLEITWWKRYLKDKDVDGYLHAKKKYWQKLLASVSEYAPIAENSLILDAGCGPAGIFLALEGNRVEAIDPLLDKYKALSHFKAGSVPWTNFRNLSIENFDETGRYDIIFCMNAINHVRDLAACYDNLVAALKPNGYLVVSTDAHRHLFLKKLFQLIPGDMLHPIQLDIQEYESQLTKRNMQIVKDIRYDRKSIFDYHITISKKMG